ncbi:unnamed protein product [Pseudo-nitzschia multistriata]|uniref:Uncharacterized protein n=1 Tax=Pseudo-nitzschia multistriata TaxID=183589 RepID=A0A448YYT4_9STRA|nr:unnamed protein product [Pseudo-nitzschia multistriata]
MTPQNENMAIANQTRISDQSIVHTDDSTKTDSVSNKTDRKSYKRPLRCSGSSPFKCTNMPYLPHSSRDLSLDTITEFPYLEDKFSMSLPCSLFSSSFDEGNSQKVRKSHHNKTRSLDFVMDAISIVGIDEREELQSTVSVSSPTPFTRSRSPLSPPSLASVSDDESVDSSRKDEERSILRESRWDDCQSRDFVVRKCDSAPTCPRRAQ